MKRQGLTITINELQELIDELWSEANFDFKKEPEKLSLFQNRRFQINIINKQPECSDTWEIENFLSEFETFQQERNTRKNKIKGNKRYPYKKGGRRRTQ